MELSRTNDYLSRHTHNCVVDETANVQLTRHSNLTVLNRTCTLDFSA